MLVRKTVTAVIVLSAIALASPARAHAYIDPGTGTYVLQMAVAGLLAASYVIEVYWRKVPSTTRSPFRGGSEDEAHGS